MGLKTHDPLRLGRVLWPDMRLSKEQQGILQSVWGNRETYVYAGNMLGKDFGAGRGIVMFFLTRSPCRIVTTSTKDKHLNVLWSEIHRAIRESVIPLSVKRGGNLIINQREIRKVVNGEECDTSYITGMVANEETMESFQGHHVAITGDGIPRTLMVGDEASSLRDWVKTMTRSWSHAEWWFGNPWDCSNFYFHALKGKPGTKDRGGNIPRENGRGGYHRRVFHIPAKASPNVRLALMQLARGEEPTGEILIPGLMPWNEYQEARKFWDPIQQKVSLDAEFPEDERTKMYPPEWLDRAEKLWNEGGCGSKVEALGVDSAQGGDNTAMAGVNSRALLELVSRKTPDTTEIVDDVVGVMRRYPALRPEHVWFDLGGGGKQHADRLRGMGYEVRSVYFGAAATPEPSPGVVTLDERVQRTEQRTAYKNKRAEMYAILRSYLNPAEGKNFALPPELLDRPRNDGGPSLREQMQAIPLSYNEEGTMYVIPKNRRDSKDTRETLTDIIGCSPDELDALVLAVYGLQAEERWSTVGVG